MNNLPLDSLAVSVLDRQDTSVLSTRARAVLDKAGPLVDFLGVAPVPEDLALLEGATTDWFVVAAERDPLVEAGRFPVPTKARRRLKAIEKSGAQFDRLFILHEEPAGTVAALRAAGTPQTGVARILAQPTTDARVPRLAAGMSEAAAVAAIGIFAVAGAMVAAPAVLGGALVAGIAGGLAGGLDPAVIGVVTASGAALPGEPACLFHLASWPRNS